MTTKKRRKKSETEVIKKVLMTSSIKCDLKGCNRVGVLSLYIYDRTLPAPQCFLAMIEGRFCCKTHMLRHLSKIKMPRYSKK